MPYTVVRKRARRRNYRRKSNANFIRRKKSSGAQQNQLLRLNSQVMKINKKLNDQTIWKQFYMENVYAGSPDGDPVPLPYKFYVIPLTRPDLWKPCFQAREDDPRGTTYYGNKFMGQSMDLRLRFFVGDTTGTCPPHTVTYWIVSMHKEGGTNVLIDTNNMQTTLAGGGTFNNGALMNQRYWLDSNVNATSQPAGLTILNKAAFKIHRYRKFYLGNVLNNSELEDAQVTTSLSSVQKNFHEKLSYRNHIKTPTAAPTASDNPVRGFTDMEIEDLEPNDRRYLIIHVSAETPVAATATAVNVAYNCLFNGRIIQGG